jgi:ankyrin repeat protein
MIALLLVTLLALALLFWRSGGAPVMSPEDAFSGNRDLVALASALKRGDLALAGSLLDAGADVNGRGRDGITPLLFVVINNQMRVIPFLMRRGADATAEMRGIGSPLTLSAAVPGGKVLALLLDGGVDVNRWSSAEEPPIFSAVRAGLLENVDRLLAAGADINVCDGVGDTALTLSIDTGAFDLAMALLERGADPKASTLHPLLGIYDWQFQPGSEPDLKRAELIRAFAERGYTVPPSPPVTPPDYP